MATAGESATRQFSQPLDILSRKLQKGRRRHTTESLGCVQKLAKGFTVDAGMLSRHDSVDYGDKVEVTEMSLDYGEKIEVHESDDTESQVSFQNFDGRHMSHFMKKPVYTICEQQRRRSACASAQSDQRLCCSLPGKYNTSSFYIQNFKPPQSFCGCADRFCVLPGRKT